MLWLHKITAQSHDECQGSLKALLCSTFFVLQCSGLLLSTRIQATVRECSVFSSSRNSSTDRCQRRSPHRSGPQRAVQTLRTPGRVIIIEVPAPLRRPNSPCSTQAQPASLHATCGVCVERRDAVVYCMLLGCGRRVVHAQMIR